MEVQDIYLKSGAHKPNEKQGCVMEWVSVKWLMAHGWTMDDAWQQLTDSPACTDPLIYQAAQRINDYLPEDERQRLIPLIDRLARCHAPSDTMLAKRVRVRVCCWASRSVLHLITDEAKRIEAAGWINAAEGWLRGEEIDAATAYYAYATAYAAVAASATATAATAYATAAAAAASAYAAAAYATAYAATAYATGDPVFWLRDLIDQWEKAMSEEGCAYETPPIPKVTR